MPEVTMPKMSDTMEEGKIVRWLKHEGDQVERGEVIAEIETDKANVEMEAYEAGVLRRLLASEGDTVPVGQAIAVLESPQEATPVEPTPRPQPEATQPMPLPEAEVAAAKEQKPPVTAEVTERILASPVARKMAEDKGIDLAQVRGTGPNGRITEADIEAYMKQQESPTAAPQVAPPAPTAGEVPSEEQELSRMRKTIAERMTRSKQSIPHFYVTAQIEMDWSAKMREELNEDETQAKVSFTDLIIKACALALRAFPSVNGSYHDDKLLLHKQINVGIAVALDDGLIVPVLHDADKKPLRQIATETRELAQRARENRLHASDLSGATFTISNLGMFDVESFIAIINPPETASLAVGTIRDVPVVADGAIGISKLMKATVSADHRVLDGAVAARFLQEVKRRLESPIGLL